MTTLAALIAERRARIEAFEKDTSSHAVHDISRPGCFGGTHFCGKALRACR